MKRMTVTIEYGDAGYRIRSVTSRQESDMLAVLDAAIEKVLNGKPGSVIFKRVRKDAIAMLLGREDS